MLENEKILLTGVTGKIAFPIARELAKTNEVWGSARLRKPEDLDKLHAAGIKPLKFDMAADDVTSLPTDFTYIFHAAVDPSGIRGDWRSFMRTNALNSGNLLYHCRPAKGFVYCSTGSTYAYQGHRPLTESDPPGVPAPGTGNYSFSKVAGEAVCTWISEQFAIPLTIIRIFSTYGPEGGAPVDRFEAMLRGEPVTVHVDKPNNYNPIFEDDYVQLGIRALEVAATPPIVVNWGGSETVSIEDYCTYMGSLVGITPKFNYTDQMHTPMQPDTTYMHEILGRNRIGWREGMKRTIQARFPDLELNEDV
jgi:nucleoside-diphosphate-sugar epimerase